MKVRVISAMVAIIIAIPFIYFGGYLFKLGICLLAVWGYKEIMDLKKTHNEIPFIPHFLGILSLLLIIYANTSFSLYKSGMSYIYLIFLVFSLIIPTLFYKKNKYTIRDAFYLIGTILFIGLGFNSLIIVRNMDILLFLYLISIPAITDSFALIFGNKFGKHKMCPEISAKKTWEGAVGGSLFGTIFPSLIYYLFFKKISILIIVITFVLTIMGQIGDLIFSKLKRENDIKDYSNIMPGHGGVLDRLDSTFAIMITYVLLSIILL